MNHRLSIPWSGIFGCVIGVFIATILKVMLIPATRDYWPSYMENRNLYMQALLKDANYSYRSEKDLYRLSQSAEDFRDEAEYLSLHVRLLCYSVDIDSENAEHMNLILRTWAKYCEKTVMFYNNHNTEEEIKKDIKVGGNVELVYYELGKNHTMSAFLDFVKPIVSQFDWFVYVPADVYLIPDNLRYYIKATESGHRTVEFLGRPDIAKLSGLWSLSDDSPLVVSRGAILQASRNLDSNCLYDSLSDPLCLLESCDSRPVNLRDMNGNEVFESLYYGNALVRYSTPQVQNVKTHFPASLYIDGGQGSYKQLLDLEYYVSHLAAYGNRPVRGSYSLM